MAGIKIVNILKDDSFQDILELFRHTDATEVIFVLPKNGRVFRTEDHFAAFASEAATANKTISILCNNDQTTTLAHKYQFRVMSSGKSTSAKKPQAVLTTQPLPSDDDEEFNQNLLDDDLELDANPNASQDEKMGRVKPDVDENPDQVDGMHIEEEGQAEAELVTAPVLSASTVAVRADLDYIDTMWRQKTREQTPPIPETPAVPGGRGFMSKVSRPFGGGHSRGSKVIASSILAGAIIVFVGVIYMTTGSANVVITPVAQAVDTQITIQVSDQFANVDADFNKLPGQLFSVSKTADQEAPATGQRDVASKARGKITVYNNYSSSPQPLVATTRFVAPNGLVFRTLRSISVPGLTVANGKTVAGSVVVDVIADGPGTNYNIEAGTFTVAAFKEQGDTDRAAKIYGQSAVAFSGGASGPSKVVTQTDFDTAKSGAVKAVDQAVKDAFIQQGNDMMVLDSIEPVIASIQSTAQPDDAANTVKVTATGTLNTIAFRTADLQKLLSQSLLKTQRLAVLPDKLTLSYSDIQFKSDTDTLTFTVSVKGTGYAPLDQQKIMTDIKGMNSARIHDYFVNLDGVDSAKVSLSPFWVRSVPQNPDRIHYQADYTTK